MKNRRIAILAAVLALSVAISPLATAAGECLLCATISIPMPPGEGGPPLEVINCLDFGERYGWSECYECMNCDPPKCMMFLKCYWGW